MPVYADMPREQPPMAAGREQRSRALSISRAKLSTPTRTRGRDDQGARGHHEVRALEKALQPLRVRLQSPRLQLRIRYVHDF